MLALVLIFSLNAENENERELVMIENEGEGRVWDKSHHKELVWIGTVRFIRNGPLDYNHYYCYVR